MSVKYLLPCPSCGEKIAVEIAQAGQEIHCKCGAGVSIPTMAGIRTLQRVEPSPEERRPPFRWEARHGVLLLGAVVICAALGMTGYLYLTRPQMPKVEMMHPWEVWMEWQYLREGVRRPSFEPSINQIVYGNYYWWMGGSAGVLAVGLMIMLSSACLPKRRLKRRIVRVPVKEPPAPGGDGPGGRS